jgi:ubiquinone biosynthesis protein COQ4
MPQAQMKTKPDTRIHPLVAWRSVQKLMKDPDATGEVFKIIDALKGDSLTQAKYKMQSGERGRALLREKPVLLERLEDREALHQMPEGSLGRAYLHFMESENLTAQGLLDASAEAPRVRIDPQSIHHDPEQIWLGERMRDIHDLYHVITGYGRDPLGEICVISFSNAQSHNRGISFIVYMAQRRDGKGHTVRDCAKEAKAHGHQASWFAAEPWEDLLEEPLQSIRNRLDVQVPEAYQKVLAEAPQAGQIKAA